MSSTAIINNSLSTPTQWHLRRFASRALRVLERHKAREPAIGSFDASLGRSAQTFIDAYDRAQAFQPVWGAEVREGKTALGTLLQKLRGWAAQVRVDIPSFDAAQIGDNPTVADDVISDAKMVIDTVDSYLATGREIAYAEAMRADLEAAIEPATVELAQAGEAHIAYSGLLAEAREAAAAFNAHLVAFRRTLSAFLGRSHPDYQKLRAVKARKNDADDDSMASALPDGVSPADDDESVSAAESTSAEPLSA